MVDKNIILNRLPHFTIKRQWSPPSVGAGAGAFSLHICVALDRTSGAVRHIFLDGAKGKPGTALKSQLEETGILLSSALQAGFRPAKLYRRLAGGDQGLAAFALGEALAALHDITGANT